MPITLVSVIVNDWLLPNWACVASAYIDNVVLFASVWTVAVCSFDRYVRYGRVRGWGDERFSSTMVTIVTTLTIVIW